MIEKFTFDLTFPKVRKKMILVKKETELREHVVLKLLSYVLYYHPRLQIEVPVNMHYKPDLAVAGEHGIPELWIDCGHVGIAKVESLARKLRTTRIVFVKTSRRELDQFKALVGKKVDRTGQIEYLAFDENAVRGFARALRKNNELIFYWQAEDVLGWVLNEEAFESSLYR